MTGKTVSGMSQKFLGICIICEYLLAVSFSLDSFPCASCRHRVRIFPRLSVRGRNELTAGLTAQWESASLPYRIVEEVEGDSQVLMCSSFLFLELSSFSWHRLS